VAEERNVFDDNIEQPPVVRRRILHSSDILPGMVEQRHIKQGLIVFRGVVADRPTNGGTHIQAYFAEDEKKLYIWNRVSKAWESATLA